MTNRMQNIEVMTLLHHDDAIYTAFIIFNKNQVLTRSMDNLIKLESWLLTKLNDCSATFGLIIDNVRSKVIAKHERKINNT